MRCGGAWLQGLQSHEGPIPYRGDDGPLVAIAVGRVPGRAGRVGHVPVGPCEGVDDAAERRGGLAHGARQEGTIAVFEARHELAQLAVQGGHIRAVDDVQAVGARGLARDDAAAPPPKRRLAVLGPPLRISRLQQARVHVLIDPFRHLGRDAPAHRQVALGEARLREPRPEELARLLDVVERGAVEGEDSL